jgi:probable HAF family extracellular repeat protein
LGTLGGPRSCAYAINSTNLIVGVADLPDHRRRAFRFVNGKMAALPPLAGGNYSAAFDVNDAGDIVGASELGSVATKPLIHAVLWRGSEPQDLGALSATGNSIAYAINNQGDVVGVSDTASGERVFLYADGKIRDLNIRGHAFAINHQRQIVGTVTPAERGRPRGFVWENGELRELDNLIPANIWHIEIAYRVNNRGQLLCSGYGNGNLHALLLNPLH